MDLMDLMDVSMGCQQGLSELHRLLGLLYTSTLAGSWQLNLSRSVSSVGERQSDTFSLPLLPKRAETFGGFDHSGPAGLNAKDKGPSCCSLVSDFEFFLSPQVASSVVPIALPPSFSRGRCCC